MGYYIFLHYMIVLSSDNAMYKMQSKTQHKHKTQHKTQHKTKHKKKPKQKNSILTTNLIIRQSNNKYVYLIILI